MPIPEAGEQNYYVTTRGIRRDLNLTIAEVKSCLHRARLYLRERLSRYLRDRKRV